MKTITTVTNLYTYDELSEKAKEKAWYNDQREFPFNDEYRATLEKFEKIFDIDVHWCNVGNSVYNYSYHYDKYCSADAAPGGDPIRLAKYIWNNFAEYIMQGKYYSTRGEYIDGKYHYKNRRSNIIVSADDCPLTGVYMDCDILQPVIDCLHYKKPYNNIDELFNDCLNSFFRAWDTEIEDYYSEEYFAEEMREREYYFTEDGEFYGGAV